MSVCISENVNNVEEDKLSPVLFVIVSYVIVNDMILLAIRIALDLMFKQLDIDMLANYDIDVVSEADDIVIIVELVIYELVIDIYPSDDDTIVVKTMNSDEDMNWQLSIVNDLKLLEDPEIYFGTLNNEDSVNELDNYISTLVISNTID